MLVFFASLGMAEEPDRNCGRPCREHPLRHAPCFTLRGRMGLYNGAPSVRIWRVGTKRMLGVSEQRFAVSGYCTLPALLRAGISWDVNLFADFVVCPFTPEEPGAMQFVCVDSAANIVVRSRGDAER